MRPVRPPRSNDPSLPRRPESGIRLSGPNEVYKLWDGEDTEVSATTALIPAAPRKNALPRLTIMTGISAGEVIALEGKDQYIVGRGRGADIRIDDSGVSREHCSIVLRDGRYFVRDLGSRNGTLVNGEGVVCAPLKAGDRIYLGPQIILQLAVLDEAEDQLARNLYEASTRDPLTGVYNRRYFSQRLEAEIAHARRHPTRLSVMLLDLDHFKQVNDRFGHAAGDALLRAVAADVSKRVRTEDLLARYGGEEFALLVRDTSLAFAYLFGERIRAHVEELRVPFGADALYATVSIGVADLRECDPAASGDDLLRLADQRLYRAKHLGRNNVCSE